MADVHPQKPAINCDNIYLTVFYPKQAYIIFLSHTPLQLVTNNIQDMEATVPYF